jgi:uncharacterized protein (TIGR00369 family)
MSKAQADTVPAGFEPVPEGLGYTDTLQPFYRRVQGGAVSFGLLVQHRHANSLGICHGGVLMTLADIAAASGANIARGKISGAPTINLSLDFISAAKQGQWLQADVERAEVKRRFGFCSGIIASADSLVARFNGTFYFPDHEGMWKGRPPPAGPLLGLQE